MGILENLAGYTYMSFRLVPKSATVNDLERRNGRDIPLFH